MQLNELFDDDDNEPLVEAKLAWRRRGGKTIKAYRCTTGPRKGKLVSDLSQCVAPRDVNKANRLKHTKAKYGTKLARKARKTKKFNPAAKKTARINKARKS